MRSASFKAAAVAALAATALFAGAASATAAGADATHVKKTSKKSKGVSVLLTEFKGGSLAVTVDATGKKATKHTWALYVDGRKVAAKKYLDKDKSKTWVIKNLPTGDVKLSAPAAKGQFTTVALDVK